MLRTGVRRLLLLTTLAALCVPPVVARGEKGARGAEPGLPAPDFQLRLLDREETVRLSQHAGERPVVLIFGSYSCPPFRSQIPALEALYAEHKDEAAFYLVYISEAHPQVAGHAVEPENEAEGISMKTHESFDDRLAAAATCQEGMELTMPVLVDTLDGYAERAYGAWPARLYIIGPGGDVAYKGDPGPVGVNADELGLRLKKLLAGERTGSTLRAPGEPQQKKQRLHRLR